MQPRILVPPGIGDVYWVLVKLEAFLKREGLDKPSLTFASHADAVYRSDQRTVPFLQMYPWVDIGNPPAVPNDMTLQPIWDEAYTQAGRTIFPGVMGYDYFISYNGIINTGGLLEACDDLDCDWYPEREMSMNEHLTWCQWRGKDYAVFFWPFYGTYENCLRDFPIENIAESIRQFTDQSGLTPVFIGAAWDVGFNDKLRGLMSSIPGAVDLVGKTALDETFGLLRGARLVCGFHSGLTNMAPVIGARQTLLLWDNRFPAQTAYACVPPDTRDTIYHVLRTSGLTVEKFVDSMLGLL